VHPRIPVPMLPSDESQVEQDALGERYQHLIPSRDEQHLPPCVCGGDAMEIALLEAQVWEGREAVVFPRRAQGAVGDVLVFVFVAGVGVGIGVGAAPRAMGTDDFLLVGSGGWSDVLSWVGVPSDMASLNCAAELGGEGGGHDDGDEAGAGAGVERGRNCLLAVWPSTRAL